MVSHNMFRMISDLAVCRNCPYSLRGETLNYKPVAKDAYIADCKHKLQR